MNNKPAFEEKAAPKGGALLEFMRYYKPHIGTFTLDLCCALVISLVDILFPVITRKILYDYIPNQMMRTFMLIALLIELSRIMAGAHYIHDVLAGMAISIVAGWIFMFLL